MKSRWQPAAPMQFTMESYGERTANTGISRETWSSRSDTRRDYLGSPISRTSPLMNASSWNSSDRGGDSYHMLNSNNLHQRKSYGNEGGELREDILARYGYGDGETTQERDYMHKTRFHPYARAEDFTREAFDEPRQFRSPSPLSDVRFDRDSYGSLLNHSLPGNSFSSSILGGPPLVSGPFLSLHGPSSYSNEPFENSKSILGDPPSFESLQRSVHLNQFPSLQPSLSILGDPPSTLFGLNNVGKIKHNANHISRQHPYSSRLNRTERRSVNQEAKNDNVQLIPAQESRSPQVNATDNEAGLTPPRTVEGNSSSTEMRCYLCMKAFLGFDAFAAHMQSREHVLFYNSALELMFDCNPSNDDRVRRATCLGRYEQTFGQRQWGNETAR